jgi:Fe2+ or Zn2+ uptake regulation protein
VQTRKTNIARLGESRPKTKVANTILAVLQQEAQPLPIGTIVRSVAARLDGINPHSIYTRVYRLAEEQRIDSIDRDGTRYYAHHGVAVSAPEAQPARDTRSAILDILSHAKEPMLLSDVVERIRDERGISKKNVYVAIARLVSDGLAKEHVIFRRRHVALAHPAPVVEEEHALDPIAMASLQSRHIPAAQPEEQPALPLPHFRVVEEQPTQSDPEMRAALERAFAPAPAQHTPTLNPTQRRVRPEPFDPAVAYAPDAAPDPPALPGTPHFIDCALKIAGLDITARITLDLPNSIAREATFRYLVRVLGELERISSDVLGVGAAQALAQTAMQLAEEEEAKRRRLEQRIALISAALLPEEPPNDQ